MTDASAIDAASKRLALALDALAAAVERRREADRGQETLDAQLHALGTDRSRLASELDAAAARARGLETNNREGLQRLEPELAALQDASVVSADRSQATQAAVAAALNSAAERIETITRRLNQTIGDGGVPMG